MSKVEKNLTPAEYKEDLDAAYLDLRLLTHACHILTMDICYLERRQEKIKKTVVFQDHIEIDDITKQLIAFMREKFELSDRFILAPRGEALASRSKILPLLPITKPTVAACGTVLAAPTSKDPAG